MFGWSAVAFAVGAYTTVVGLDPETLSARRGP